MIPLILRLIVLAVWSAEAVASPVRSSDQDHSNVNHGKILTHEPEYDPLWEKYGLNKSQEFKYFHEPGNDDILGHYDTRFFTEPVPDKERSETMTHMIRAYLNFFNERGLETWIAHGTLLGWWWNGKVLFAPRSLGTVANAGDGGVGSTLGLGHRHTSAGYHPAAPG